jgi:hypothetical protein
MVKRKSWVLDYAKREGDRAFTIYVTVMVTMNIIE